MLKQTAYPCLVYFMATSFAEIPISELIIFALAIAIERLFLAPLKRNATPSLILLVDLFDFFNINCTPVFDTPSLYFFYRDN